MLKPRKVPTKLVRQRLDLAGVDDYFAGLTRAEELEIRTKGAAESRSEAAPTVLEDARRMLASGEVLAVQLRYFQDQAWWCDTIMSARGSYRLVRMQQS